jgi:subtilisin-like proprotein convertase family protein
MISKTSPFLLAAVIAGGPAFAQASSSGSNYKVQMYADMLSLDQQARVARTSGNPALAAELMQKFDQMRAAMGGDDPRTGRSSASSSVQPVAQSGAAQLISVVCGGGATSTTSVSNAPALAIPDLGTIMDTIVVSGAPTLLWDVDCMLNIPHTWSSDLDVTVTSPAGTVVTITTDNAVLGTGAVDVYAGTLFDDTSVNPINDYLYVSGVTVPTVTCEEPLLHFRGEDPNGTWTISVTDDLGGDTGTLVSWGLDLTTIGAIPAPTTAINYANPTSMPIPDPGFVTSTIVVSGAGASISDINLTVFIPHPYSNDLEVTLQSPSGTTIPITTDNGANKVNVFNGTLFDDQVPNGVMDAAYFDFIVTTPVTPESPFERFNGEDPNGTWTLTVTDDAAADVGVFNGWSMDIATCALSGAAFCSGDGSLVDHTTNCPCGNNGAAGNGCAHSFNAGGANMTATGSTLADDIVLHSSGEPSASFTLMMQHGNAGDAVFHDGVLCAANPLIRLRGRAAVAGEAFFPNSNFAQDSTTTLSIRGGTFPGSGATMRYAGWFRNASTTFCPPATANVTNGWVITW